MNRHAFYYKLKDMNEVIDNSFCECNGSDKYDDMCILCDSVYATCRLRLVDPKTNPCPIQSCQQGWQLRLDCEQDCVICAPCCRKHHLVIRSKY